MSQSCLQPVASDLQISAQHKNVPTCEQHNAIHSKQAGVGVDIKILTPESESTPMKTLSCAVLSGTNAIWLDMFRGII